MVLVGIQIVVMVHEFPIEDNDPVRQFTDVDEKQKREKPWME
jgi:hypothetical protein